MSLIVLCNSMDIEAALLEAERLNEPVDGGLLGMAAAQARARRQSRET